MSAEGCRTEELRNCRFYIFRSRFRGSERERERYIYMYIYIWTAASNAAQSLRQQSPGVHKLLGYLAGIQTLGLGA